MTEIRIAKDENDSVSASKIFAESWKAAYKGIISDETLSGVTPDFWVNMFNSNYDNHRFEVAILSAGGEDAGAGGYGMSRDYGENSGEILSIYFLDKVWGKGYSKPLIDFMLNRLREKGYEMVHLWTLRDNVRARKFYEKCGFSFTGKEKYTTVNITGKSEALAEVEYELKL